MDKGGSSVVLSASQTVLSKIPASLNGLNESQLRAMLETTFNFEERLAIRRAIRQQRKKNAESQEASKTTLTSAGSSASHLQKHSSQERTRLSKPNGKNQHKSNGKTSARTLSTSNLEVKTTFKPHETNKSGTVDGQTTHGPGKESLDSGSSSGKAEQKIYEHVGLQSGKLDKNCILEKDSELDSRMDEVESKNMKNIFLKDTVSAKKELKEEYVREIRKEPDGGRNENGKEKLDVDKHGEEPRKENVSCPDEMENGSECEVMRDSTDEKTIQKDDEDTKRETGKNEVDVETNVEISHRLVEVHIDGRDDAESKHVEGDSQDEPAMLMEESHQMTNPVNKLIEKEEKEEAVNKEENEAGEDIFSQDDCCLESEKVGLSAPEITEKIPSHRIEESHVESDTDRSFEMSGVVGEVVGHQLEKSKQQEEGDLVSKDCNSNETEEKEEKRKEFKMESLELKLDSSLSSDSHNQNNLSGLGLELYSEEKGKTSHLERTEREAFKGSVEKLDRIDDNILNASELQDETISQKEEGKPQKVCDSTNKIRSIDSECKGNEGIVLSREQDKEHDTLVSDGEKRFIVDEINYKKGALTYRGDKKELKSKSESEKSESVEVKCEGKVLTTSSRRKERLLRTSEGSAKAELIDSDSKGKDGKLLSQGEEELHETFEKRDTRRSIETDSVQKNETTSSQQEEELLEIPKSSAKTRFIETESKGKDTNTLSEREREPQVLSEKNEINRSAETECEVIEKKALSEKESKETTNSREASVETGTDGKGTTLSEKQEASEEEEKKEVKLEDINDERILRDMLDNSLDFDERRRIRAAIRALKKKQQNQPTPEKKIVQQSYLNLQNSSWKSGRNTPVSKTGASPKKLNNSGRKLSLGKQSSPEKELSQHYEKSDLTSRNEAKGKTADQISSSNKQDNLSATKEEEISEERLSSKKVSSVLGKQQRYNSSSQSYNDLTEQKNRKVPSETVKVECTHEGERDDARQRRREWQKSLLQSCEEPSSSEGDGKQEEENISNVNRNSNLNRIESETKVKTQEALSKKHYSKSQSQEDDDDTFLTSENSFDSEGSFSKRSSSTESSDQSNEISNESPSRQMSETGKREGAIQVSSHTGPEICGSAVLQEKSHTFEEKSAISSEDRSYKNDKGSSGSLNGVKKLAETKQSSFSSKMSSSFEVEIEIGEKSEPSKRTVLVDAARVEMRQGENSKGHKDSTKDGKRDKSFEEPMGTKEEKLPSLQKEKLDKAKEERSTFMSSRWREPKKANFKDLRKQFQVGFEKQKEEKKEDRALKGVKGRVSQAALLFNSPSSSSPPHQRLPLETSTPKRGSSSTPRKTSDRRITDQKLEGNSTRRFSSEFSLSDKRKNKAETISSLQVDFNKDEETSLNKGVEESPSTSVYMTPVGTPGSPDIFYTPKEVMDGTPTNLTDRASLSKQSEVEEQSLLHSKRTTVVEGDQYRKKVKVEAGKPLPEETPQTQETTMAPTVEQITDETMLEKMLEEATIFEDRKKIRARLRELRKQKRGEDTSSVTTERKRTRASALTVNTTQKSTENNEIKPVGTTALSPISPAAKTVRTDSNLANDHTTKVVETDDGKTKTMTMTSVKTAPGAKSTQVTTMSKTEDGSGTKAASVKQETTTTKIETSSDGTKTSFSKTTTSTFSSSSSSSTDKPATGKPQSKFQLELEEKRKKRAEQQKADEAKWKADQEARRKAAYEKKKREEAEAAKKKASLMDKFGGKATTVGPTGPKKTVAGGSTRMMAQNPATIKAKLLEWAKRCTRGYANVKIENFSGSWCDGMAFCAVVHSYFPDAFDFNALDPKNRRQNFDLAFDTAEKYADIYPLLETDDMIMMKNKPDWKCVFTYVQALYRGLHKATGQVPT